MNRKVAVVTGSSSGIGAEVVRQLAARGARPVLFDIDERRGRALAAEVAGHFIKCDVADPGDWAAAMAACVETVGAPTYLHLNAGVMSVPSEAAFAAIEDLPLDNYRRIVAVNLDGVVFGLQTALPHMREGGGICVTASLAGLVPLPVDPMYSATKHALIGLVRSVAASPSAARVRINAICPGGVDTPIVPDALRAAGIEMMSTASLASEVLDLLEHGKNGEIRVRLSETSPAFSVPAPVLP